jgi:hypothetical protein
MNEPDQPGRPVTQIRTSAMARGVFGFVFCLLTILAIGLYSEGKILFGVATFVLASAMLVYGWFQTIELAQGELIYFRPFLKTVRFPLREITRVRLVFPQSGRANGAGYRRYQLFQGDKMLCSLNPKLFPEPDVAGLLEQIRQSSPGVEIQDAMAGDFDASK